MTTEPVRGGSGLTETETWLVRVESCFQVVGVRGQVIWVKDRTKHDNKQDTTQDNTRTQTDKSKQKQIIKEQKQKAKIQKGTGTAKTRVKENMNQKRKLD